MISLRKNEDGTDEGEEASTDLARLGLDRAPFAAEPDPRFFVATPQNRHALKFVQMAAAQLSPVTLLLGEAGIGKSTLAKRMAATVSTGLRVGLFRAPAHDPSHPFERVLAAFDSEAAAEGPQAARDRLLTLLVQTYEAGRASLLIVDDAHRTSHDDLRALAQLIDVRPGATCPLILLLVGLPDLRDRLEEPTLRPLARRVEAATTLLRMAEPETAGFIRHRLTVAGGSTRLFDDGAVKAVHAWSQGLPQATNALCATCLDLAARRNGRHVDAATVEAAIEARLMIEPEGKSAEPQPEAPPTPQAPSRDRPINGPGTLLEPDPRSEVSEYVENPGVVELLEPEAPAAANAHEAPPPRDADPDLPRYHWDVETGELLDAGPAGQTEADDPGTPVETNPQRETPEVPEDPDARETSDPVPDARTDEAGAPTPLPATEAESRPPPAPAIPELAPFVLRSEAAVRETLALRGRDRVNREAQEGERRPALVLLSDLTDAPQESRDAAPRRSTPAGPTRRALNGILDGALAAGLAVLLLLPVLDRGTPAPTPALAPAVTAPVQLTADDLYREGLRLGAEDPAAAAIAYARAAIRGHDRSAYYLAQMYETGDGVPLDRSLARSWYRVAEGRIGPARERLEVLSPAGMAEESQEPTPLYSGRMDGGEVELVWTAAAGAGDFVVEIARDPQNGADRALGVAGSAVRLPQPGDGAAYWRVAPKDAPATATSWLPIDKGLWEDPISTRP